MLGGHTVGTGISSYQGLYASEVGSIVAMLGDMGKFSLCLLFLMIIANILAKRSETARESKYSGAPVICFVLSLILLGINISSYLMYN